MYVYVHVYAQNVGGRAAAARASHGDTGGDAGAAALHPGHADE